MKTVKFWSRIRHDGYDDWRLVDGEDPSDVPLEAWMKLNKEFWKRRQRGLFAPLDELEAYQITCSALVKASECVRTGSVVLHKCSLSTYLVGAAFNCFNKYQSRQVARVRQEHRAIAAVAKDADGEPLDSQAYVETLADDGSLVRQAAQLAVRRDARRLVGAVLPRLDADAQAGLRAFMAANGIFRDAARLYNPSGSAQGYIYRFRHLWMPAFRRLCSCEG